MGWLVLTVAVLSVSCAKPGDSAADKLRKSRAVPVTVAPVILKDVPLEINTFGKAQSKASVTIRAQIAQVLETVHFQEGQKISRGDLLFTLNRRSSEAALAHARADLARDKILSDTAHVEEGRDAELLARDVLSQEDYDKAKSATAALAETLMTRSTKPASSAFARS